MESKRALLGLLLAVTTVWGCGCKTTMVGPEGQTKAIYEWGRLTAEEPNNINAVYQATEKALTALELSITQKTKDELAATVVARDSQDRRFAVGLVAITTDSTKITIEAGSFVKARRVYQKILDSLKK